MRKEFCVIATTLATGGVIAAPAWAGQSPTATTAPPPHAGVYTGRTSQKLDFSVRVSPSRTLLSQAKFGFRVHCADHRTLLFTVSPIVAGQPWRLNADNGMGFTHAFHDTTDEQYRIRGHFTAMGTVTGTLSTTWHSPHNGLCRSGRIDWHAALGH